MADGRVGRKLLSAGSTAYKGQVGGADLKLHTAHSDESHRCVTAEPEHHKLSANEQAHGEFQHPVPDSFYCAMTNRPTDD